MDTDCDVVHSISAVAAEEVVDEGMEHPQQNTNFSEHSVEAGLAKLSMGVVWDEGRVQLQSQDASTSGYDACPTRDRRDPFSVACHHLLDHHDAL